LIAANWAIHGAAKDILGNPWAKFSMAVAVGYLGAHLVAAGYMALLYRFRGDYADEDKDRWNREFRDNRDKASPWPYTQRIENLALFLHP
jgi:hypothetical protein